MEAVAKWRGDSVENKHGSYTRSQLRIHNELSRKSMLHSRQLHNCELYYH